MSLCKDCIKGVRHEGEPEGKWEVVNGVNSYIATPKGEYPKDKAILFLTDVFGPQLINAQLLADDFATNNNVKTIVPDYLNNDPIPSDAFSNPDFNIMGWLANHGNEQTRPPVDKVLAALKDEGVTTLGATGYCFGGRYVFDLAFENLIQVAIVSHPSLLKVPEDLEKYHKLSKAPLLINSCTIDQQFPLESQAKADAILGDGSFAPGYKREYFDGCTHGFAVRADLSDPKAKAGKEGSFKASVEWFGSKL